MTPSEWIKNKNAIYMTSDEKKEFDDLSKWDWNLYGALHEISAFVYPKLHERLFTANGKGKYQLEFARAWENPDLIVVKDPEPRFAYKMKDKFIHAISNHTDTAYLGKDGKCWSYPDYHTAKEWQAVDNDLKVIFDRVEEK